MTSALRDNQMNKAALALVIALSACTTDRDALNAVALNYAYTGSRDMPLAGTHEVCTRVTLVDTVAEISKACNGRAACGRTYPVIAGDTWLSMTAVRPQSFNDKPALILLGHEFLHNLGANHD